MAAFTVPTTSVTAGCAASAGLAGRPRAARVGKLSCSSQMSSQIKTAESLQGENLTCMRQNDGSLLIEHLPAGQYNVSPAPPTWTGKAFCSVSEGQRKCVTYCTLDDDFQLRCEGLEEGVYEVNPASATDVSHMVTHIWSTTSYHEDDEAANSAATDEPLYGLD